MVYLNNVNTCTPSTILQILWLLEDYFQILWHEISNKTLFASGWNQFMRLEIRYAYDWIIDVCHMYRLLPSTHFAPTSSKSLRASYFKSEPMEIHLNNPSTVNNGIKSNEQQECRQNKCVHKISYWTPFLAQFLTKLYAFPVANFPRSIQQLYGLYQHQLHHQWRNLLWDQ